MENVIIEPLVLTIEDEYQHSCNGLLFIPKNNNNNLAIFTHGITGHKADLVNWASRISQLKMTCIIFDLPGHILGSFNKVHSMKWFQNNSHLFFIQAKKEAEKIIKIDKIIVGGHSLGALLSLKALNILPCNHAICVGIGINENHPFKTELFKDILNIRNQLISPKLDLYKMIDWIYQEKKNISLSDKNIYLIGGSDDIIAPPNAVNTFANVLKSQNNSVQIIKAKNLPHNRPELAAPHIVKLLKDIN